MNEGIHLDLDTWIVPASHNMNKNNKNNIRLVTILQNIPPTTILVLVNSNTTVLPLPSTQQGCKK